MDYLQKNTIRLYILQSTLYLKEAIFKYNRIAIGLQSDSFPTHTHDDKDIKIKIKDNHIDAVDDDNSTEMASLEPPSEDMPEEDNSSDVADMEASEKEGACILDIPINSSWSEILMM